GGRGVVAGDGAAGRAAGQQWIRRGRVLGLAARRVEALRLARRVAHLAGMERIPVGCGERALDRRAVAGLGVGLDRVERRAAALQVAGEERIRAVERPPAPEATEAGAKMPEVVGVEQRDLGVGILGLRL